MAEAVEDAEDGTDDVQQAADARSSELKDLLTQLPEDDEHASDNPYQLMADLESVMEKAVAVRCDANSIEQAQSVLRSDLEARAQVLHAHSDSATFNQEITAIWEVRHLLGLGSTMLAASGARHESRGSLKRLDFPERDDEQFLAHSMVNASGQISWQPVHIVNMPPKAREY
jgi:succinate dehydrogenase / fumarate reductase flavoprotein subunit